AQSGKLNSCVAQWMGSYSTAAATSNPACSKPRLSPPAPAKRSTPIGFLPLPLIERKSLPNVVVETILWRTQELIKRFWKNRPVRRGKQGRPGQFLRNSEGFLCSRTLP